MKNWRRYEILLPLRFNDGKRIPRTLLAQSVLDLENRFGGVSSETQIIHGRWRSKATSYRDDLVRVYVDAEGTAEVEEFFIEFKQKLKARFEQLEIWVTSMKFVFYKLPGCYPLGRTFHVNASRMIATMVQARTA